MDTGPMWYDIGEPAKRGDMPNAASPESLELARTLQSYVGDREEGITETQRRANALNNWELYMGLKLTSLYQLGNMGYERLWNADSLYFNVCKSIVDSVRNRICSFRPRAEFLPDGGDHLAAKAAEDMQGMCDAAHEEMRWQQQASLAFRDALIADGGVLKHSVNENGKAVAERFPSWEFIYDDADSIYGRPRCVYHVQYLPKESAQQKFKLSETEMTQAPMQNPPGVVYWPSREVIRCVEGWAAAIGEEGDDDYIPGRHVIVIGNTVKLDEAWEWEDLPVEPVVADEGIVGMWGVGVITPIRGLQIELYNEQALLTAAHQAASSLIILLQNDEAAPQKLDNDYAKIVRYTNNPPQVINPAAVNPERYQYLELLKKQAYETIGVSQFIAAGQKQAGLNSAVAIREATELQSDRLALYSQMWEQLSARSAKWWWRLTRREAQITKRKPNWVVVTEKTWRKMTFDDLTSEYHIRPFPSSLFGNSMAAKVEKAQELIQQGMLTKEDALRVLRLPDLSPVVDLQLAQSYLMESTVDHILRDGKYTAPNPYVDPVAFGNYAKNRYMLAEAQGSDYPEENLALLRRFVDACTPTQQVAQAQAQAQAMAPQAQAQQAGQSPQAIPQQAPQPQQPGAQPQA